MSTYHYGQLLDGGETFECWFYLPSTATRHDHRQHRLQANHYCRRSRIAHGWFPARISVVGIYTATAYAYDTALATGSNATNISTLTWYHAIVTIGSGASNATFTILNSTTGAAVMSDSVSSHIPNIGGKEVGNGVIVTDSTITNSAAIMWVDKLAMSMPRTLTRY